jgi:hypothetical protein
MELLFSLFYSFGVASRESEQQRTARYWRRCKRVSCGSGVTT